MHDVGDGVRPPSRVAAGEDDVRALRRQDAGRAVADTAIGARHDEVSAL